MVRQNASESGSPCERNQTELNWTKRWDLILIQDSLQQIFVISQIIKVVLACLLFLFIQGGDSQER